MVFVQICNSLNELINWFQRNQINEEGEMLREPCGQEVCRDFHSCSESNFLRELELMVVPV